jgi:hypothetical protein
VAGSLAVQSVGPITEMSLCLDLKSRLDGKKICRCAFEQGT